MLIHKEKAALLLRLKDPNRVLTVIPKSRKVLHEGVEYVAVCHGSDEVRVLNNLGIAAPPPILSRYSWPSGDGLTPFAAQLTTAAFFTMHERMFCLNEMGTGKTLASLWGYDYLRSEGVLHRAMIVSTLSTLERTWADEVFTHLPHLTVSVVYGSRAQRLKALATPADIYIINHDGLKVPGIVEALGKRPDIDLMLIDEIAQAVRNSGTDRFKAFNVVCNRQVPRRVWGMTGSPVPEAPTDAWAQCRVTIPANTDKYFSHFRERVMRRVGPYAWVPREGAQDVVFQSMQPAIRFKRDECFDLPECVYESKDVELSDEQTKAYKQMSAKLVAEVADGQITALNEAAKGLKLVQIACLAYNTDVLTPRGWVPIQCVTVGDLVWDGDSWVTHGGVVFKGVKPVVGVRGVRMTEDHEVWVGEWVTAKEVLYGNAGERLDRTAVRLPYGYVTTRHDVGGAQGRNLELPVRLRDKSRAGESVFACSASSSPTKLWVSPRKRNAQDDKFAVVRRMGQNEAAMREPTRQRLGKLWRAGNRCLCSMERILSIFLRRHACRVQTLVNSWADRQRWWVLAGELPLGDANATELQSTHECFCRDSEGPDGSGAGGEAVWAKTGDSRRATGQIPLVSNAGVDRTYDVTNCGPKNRFVVRGAGGTPLIVHNCGIAYGEEHEEVTLDATARMNVVLETIEEAATKVIVFAPFVAVVKHLAEFLRRKGVTCECIYGEVGKSERDRIFGEFQHGPHLRCIVAQPSAMSHGLTLTAANTIIWYAPVTRNETFEQANARITRAGQKHTQLIMMIAGTEIERRWYRRLKNKQDVQGVLLDMVQGNRKKPTASVFL